MFYYSDLFIHYNSLCQNNDIVQMCLWDTTEKGHDAMQQVTFYAGAFLSRDQSVRSL